MARARTAATSDAQFSPADYKRRHEATLARRAASKAVAEQSRNDLAAAAIRACQRYTENPTKARYRAFVTAARRAQS